MMIHIKNIKNIYMYLEKPTIEKLSIIMNEGCHLSLFLTSLYTDHILQTLLKYELVK